MKFVFENPAFSCALLQAMDCTAFGGADVEECLHTAERIRENDLESWHAEWVRTADTVRRQAGQFLAEGRSPVARDAFLRASTYYRMAETFLGMNPGDPRQETTRQSGAVCFVMAARLSGGKANTTATPQTQRGEGFFFSAGTAAAANAGSSSDTQRRPVVVVWGDASASPMDMYFAAAAPSVRRGYHAAQAGTRNPSPAFLRNGLNELLTARPDADPERIALVRVSAPAIPCASATAASLGEKQATRLPVRRLRADVLFAGTADGAMEALCELEASDKGAESATPLFDAEHRCTGELARLHHRIFRIIDERLTK